MAGERQGFYRFKGRELERGRKYLWRREFTPLLYKYLSIHPGLKIADIGCGTGYFSRLIGRKLRGQGKVVGVDNDGRLLSMARSLVKEEQLDSVISFHKGLAEDIPLRTGEYDRVVCQTLLRIFRDPRIPLREMTRICKPGGLVGTVEGGFDYVNWYIPDNSRHTELNRKTILASTLGHMKIYGADRGVGYKLPALFEELGLERVRLDAYAYVWLESDDRISRAFKLRQHKEYLRRYGAPLDEQRRKYRRVLIRGGMKSDEIEELRRLDYDRSARIVADPSLIDKDFETHAGIYYITTGLKPRD